MSKHFIIGTRGSLLAKTQCTLFKNLLEEKTGNTFELKFISTQGDQQTDKPLWQMEGQNFFTKELDSALLSEEVDFVVHSYKDLGSIRPEGTEIAAISKRVFPEDILLVPNSNIDKIKDQKEIIIGTSSPRRITNIENHLKKYIPCHESAQIKTKTLRGNVNSRIQKLRDGQYDGIVLAMAGLERLAMMQESYQVLEELLKNMNFVILPQKSFPSAASQGALAVEVNKESSRYNEIKEVLQSGHDPESAKTIKTEREIFNKYGGGCHLAVGIHVKKHKDKTLIIERGFHNEENIHQVYFQEKENIELGKIKSFIGKSQQLINQTEIENKINYAHNIFVTSKYCIASIKEQPTSLWASGAKTHKKLASKGFWVNGSADGLGHEQIQRLKKSNLLKILLSNTEFTCLSHEDASSPLGNVIGCYKREINPKFELTNFDFDTCFWGSYSHYLSYTEKYPELKAKNHACGLGKTYDQFVQNSINVVAIAHMKDIKLD